MADTMVTIVLVYILIVNTIKWDYVIKCTLRTGPN